MFNLNHYSLPTLPKHITTKIKKSYKIFEKNRNKILAKYKRLDFEASRQITSYKCKNAHVRKEKIKIEAS